MKKGDTVEFNYYHRKEKQRLRGIYLGFNGVAHIVLRENVYYWVKP